MNEHEDNIHITRSPVVGTPGALFVAAAFLERRTGQTDYDR